VFYNIASFYFSGFLSHLSVAWSRRAQALTFFEITTRKNREYHRASTTTVYSETTPNEQSVSKGIFPPRTNQVLTPTNSQSFESKHELQT
jgi:hypothetical protein